MFELTRLTVPWTSYSSWKYSGYPNCLTCAPWATPGGTGSEVVAELSTAARGGSGPGWWNIPLQEKMVQEWVTGGEPVNFGVAVSYWLFVAPNGWAMARPANSQESDRSMSPRPAGPWPANSLRAIRPRIR